MSKPEQVKGISVDKGTLIQLERGKIPPQAIDLEEVILGALMIDEKAHDDAIPLIKSNNVFYKEAHMLIFGAIKHLYTVGEKIDLLTVSHHLKSKGLLDKAGGDFYLISLTQKVSSSAHTEYHTRILLQKWIRRESIRAGQELTQYSYDDTADVFDVLERFEHVLDKITGDLFADAQSMTLGQAMDQVTQNVERLTELQEFEIVGVPTGFKELDLFTGGWQNSDLICVAGRPSMGKSAILSRFTLASAMAGMPVGIFSLEMSTVQLVTRLMANHSHFHLNQLFRHGFKKESEAKKSEYFKTLNLLKGEMAKYNIQFCDIPGIDIKELKARARIWKRKHGIRLLLVDYLQLVTDESKEGFREQEISSVSRNLKGLAKELDIPVIALAQLSRKVEERASKMPQLSDLRESGAIEQDCDMIAFLMRPEYYNLSVPDDLVAIGANTIFKIDKHRNGSIGQIGISFDKNKTSCYRLSAAVFCISACKAYLYFFFSLAY